MGSDIYSIDSGSLYCIYLSPACMHMNLDLIKNTVYSTKYRRLCNLILYRNVSHIQTSQQLISCITCSFVQKYFSTWNAAVDPVLFTTCKFSISYHDIQGFLAIVYCQNALRRQKRCDYNKNFLFWQNIANLFINCDSKSDITVKWITVK